MKAPYGIRILLSGVHFWAGWGVQAYAFKNAADAREYIDSGWGSFSAAWKHAHLSVGKLSPYITVRPEMLLVLL